MHRFNDKYLQSIDQRGRLQLPRDVRNGFKIKKGDTLYLFANPNVPISLEIRTKAQCDAYLKKALDLPASRDKREFLRMLRLGHEQVLTDGQGRFVLPQRLRHECDFDSEVVIINMEHFVEVWKKESVEQKFNNMLRAFNDINDQLF
jgi:division/cell wall cluster transcriptional repressor MraZ